VWLLRPFAAWHTPSCTVRLIKPHILNDHRGLHRACENVKVCEVMMMRDDPRSATAKGRNQLHSGDSNTWIASGHHAAGRSPGDSNQPIATGINSPPHLAAAATA
jgi:hypothetical protein